VLKTILRYYHTLKYLKWQQVYYRIYYFVRQKVRRLINFELKPSKTCPLIKDLPKMIPSIDSPLLYDSKEFLFLNLRKELVQPINWNFSDYGKLWTYNLNYFEYLHQKNFDKTIGLSLINDFIDHYGKYSICSEPFPISLRIIFWIRFLIKHDINDDKITNSLWLQSHQLVDQREFHLLGNHLLENAFALFFAAYYFQDKCLFNHAKKILCAELPEQTLADGGHFELSPMYHQIMLYRLLDCYNLAIHNRIFDEKLEVFFKIYIEKMLGWLFEVTYRNGAIPMVNDSAPNIAPTTQQLNQYAQSLSVFASKITLKESGYRMFRHSLYELFVDVGKIGADYIPGHAHSDTFNFELHFQTKPLIIDSGVSTYEINIQRNSERSTKSHNTVELQNCNQSDVWGGFRVARRASSTILEETLFGVKASHDGYKHIGLNHTRSFRIDKQRIFIKDDITNNKIGKAFFFFHPEIQLLIRDNKVFLSEHSSMSFVNSKRIEMNDAIIAMAFNKVCSTKSITVDFTSELETIIELGVNFKI
jgi:uncharacterized heparinase superfamily protein